MCGHLAASIRGRIGGRTGLAPVRARLSGPGRPWQQPAFLYRRRSAAVVQLRLDFPEMRMPVRASDRVASSSGTRSGVLSLTVGCVSTAGMVLTSRSLCAGKILAVLRQVFLLLKLLCEVTVVIANRLCCRSSPFTRVPSPLGLLGPLASRRLFRSFP